MEGLGIAANVIAVVDLSVKVADWCVEYCKSTKNAKDDIVRFRLEVIGLQSAANGVKELLTGPSGERLKVSQQLCNSVRHSESELQAVYERLRPTSAREVFTRLGLRTLRWPFQGKEVEKIVQNIVRCTQAINLALQADQMTLLLDLDQKTVLARLENEVVKDASYDSRAEEHNPTCLQDTRVELLQQIAEWAHDPGAEAVFWLNGMAGTGKSTISRTVAHAFAGAGHLGASFFFQKGRGRCIDALLKYAVHRRLHDCIDTDFAHVHNKAAGRIVLCGTDLDVSNFCWQVAVVAGLPAPFAARSHACRTG
ncbi:hypothetical protein ACCO45_012696 [Purpureocillium lilacinum]|uniref:Uncharacterized protein n=1 Tax=Purpureocillium lilacinum TaxID=33203 RepID=A0ACC4D9E1_PURLI